MKPLISVIITLYNYEEYVAECIASCIEQTYDNFEIIVVDDCSTDGSYEVAERFTHHIRLFKTDKNRGYSHAKNVGIREAKGDFIVHLDADDMLLPDSLETRYRYFEENPKIDMVHGRAWRWIKTDGRWHTDGFNKKAVIHAQTIMIRKSVFERFGLFYEKLRSKADKEMTYRLGVHRDSPLMKQIKVKKVKDFVALYRKHDQQMHKCRKKDKKQNDKINKIFKKRIKRLKKEGITKMNISEWL